MTNGQPYETFWHFFFFFRSYLFNIITCCFLFERRLNTFFSKFLAQIIRLDSWYFKAFLEIKFCVLNRLMTVTQSLNMKVNEKIKSLAKVIGCLEINNSDLRLTHSIWHHSLKFAAHYLEMNHSSGIVRKFYEKCKACFLGNFDESVRPVWWEILMRSVRPVWWEILMRSVRPVWWEILTMSFFFLELA